MTRMTGRCRNSSMEYGLSYYPDIPTRSAESNPEQLAKAKAMWDTPWMTSLELTSVHDAAAAAGKPFVVPEVQTAPQTGLHSIRRRAGGRI